MRNLPYAGDPQSAPPARLQLALDDFGTGYSNLAMLHRMPFNELKIDRSFVAEVSASRDSQVIVGALAGLARQLGLTTVAEGVEDLDTWAWLRSVGVEQIQGFGIARPMPAELVVDWIADYKPPRIDRLSWRAPTVPEAERRHHVRGRERLDQRHRRPEAGLADPQDVLLIGAHQDGDGLRVAIPDQAGHLDAAEPRQVDFQEDVAEALLGDRLQGAGPVRRLAHLVTLGRHHLAEHRAVERVVVDDQHAGWLERSIGRRARLVALGPCLGGGGVRLMGADAVGPAQQRERPPDLLGAERLGITVIGKASLR